MKLSIKIIIFSGAMLVCAIFMETGFYTFLKSLVKDQMGLSKRNAIRNMYLKIPIPLNFKIYFFNITNPLEVQNGATPILKQVGPYCYDEFKEKINVIDNDAQDTLQYDSFDTYIFNKTLSGKLSDEDYVTIIHPLLVGIVNTVNATSPALLSIVNQAINKLFKEPKSIYLTDKVKNILFDGMEINCRENDFASKAVCTQLKSQISDIKESTTQKNVLLYSLFGQRNATIVDTIKIMRGIKNYRDLGRVLEVNGKSDINLWGSEHCNRFKGTDGWIIPPLLKPEEGIRCYATQLCRNIALDYVEDEIIKGFNVRRYEGNLGDQQLVEADKCYCPSPKRCLRKGVFDLSKCLGAPIIASLPHFLYADEIFLSQVRGLEPIKENHVLAVTIDPISSAPLSLRMRIQMNLEIGPNPKITVMNNLTDALHPIFWLEDSLDMEGPVLKKVSEIYVAIKVANVLKWFALAIFFVFFAFGIYLHFKNRKSAKITPVQRRPASDKDAFHKRTNGGQNNIMSGHEFDRYN